MLPPGLGSSPSALLVGAAVGGVLAWLLARSLAGVGFRFAESAMLFVAAPLLSTWEAPAPVFERGAVVVAANGAGLLIPLAVSAKVLLERRVDAARVSVCIAATALTAYPMSFAIPDHGILLFYRVPALVAGLAALVLCWRRWAEAGLVAFVGGSIGVVLGADLAHLPELLDAGGARRIVLGGAGVLDGIFLVGVLAALVVTAGVVADRAWQAASRRLAGPAEESAPA